MGRHKTHINLLKSLLAPLIDEWGADTVRVVLDKMMVDLVDTHEQQSGKGNSGDGKKKRAQKPTAVQIVSRLDVTSEVRAILDRLAIRYDAKEFLATAADIRQFFEDKGIIPPVVKHRSDAFRKVASVLCELPQESLELLLVNRAYSGPSRLGPLSRAIRNSSENIREKPLNRSSVNESSETEKISSDVLEGKNDSD